VRDFVEAGMTAVSGALTPSRARDLAKSLTRGEGRDQVNRVAQDLLDWSQRSRGWVAELVQREVKRQLSSLGIATRDDLDSMRKRVRELERASGLESRKAGSKKSGSRKVPTTKSRPKKAAAKSTRRASDATGVGDPGAGVV
jgi:polyhydroxyalkanoate synthesis regulator phasin